MYIIQTYNETASALRLSIMQKVNNSEFYN